MIPFLIESALLTHGLVSISQEELSRRWPRELDAIAWVDGGNVVIGTMEEFLPFRARASQLRRIDCDRLPSALAEGISGALTASGTMAVCRERHIPLAVTCGMGGIGDIKGEELCPDLPALRDIPVALISSNISKSLKAGSYKFLPLKSNRDMIQEVIITIITEKKVLVTAILKVFQNHRA